MGTVNPELRGMLPDLSTMTKKSKGRKRAEKVVPLDRIIGYTDDANADEDDEDKDDDEDDSNGMLDRNTIKRMAAKMAARAAKARAETEH
jgi:hypothetical protein